MDYCLTADNDDYVRQYSRRTPVDRSQQWYLIPDEAGNFVYLRSRKNVTGGEARYLAIENGRARVVQFNPSTTAVSEKAASLRLFFIEYPLKVSLNPEIADMAINPATDSTNTNENANADRTIQDSFGDNVGSQGAVAIGSR